MEPPPCGRLPSPRTSPSTAPSRCSVTGSTPKARAIPTTQIARGAAPTGPRRRRASRRPPDLSGPARLLASTVRRHHRHYCLPQPVQKYVVSSTMAQPDWQNSKIFTSDVVNTVGALKEEPGQDIVVTGSITLCHALIEAGLVDQYRLFVYPVVQGRGRRLFPDGFEVPRLKLLDAKAFRCGITYLSYAPTDPPLGSSR